jgi:hypothetical protein
MTERTRSLMIKLLASLMVLSVPVPFGLAGTLDFNRDVRPILSEKCYFCHGPDENTRHADLRLDTADGAQEAVASGEFLARIHTDDPELVMPKPESKLTLSDAEKQTLQRWLESGAKYDSHWSFQLLPESTAIPSTKVGEAWARSAIDKFIASGLESQGLKPNAEADPIRWLRRVTLDLTGLPPTVEAIEAFEKRLSSNQSELYSEVVDQLLQSPAFGEHLASIWLDAARYADSYGYQSDKLNNQWPYRDWVIRALNANLPYDQFLRWQLAGDLFPNPSQEQRLATAFNRIHRLNNEGGAVFEEWRQENVADRVHTFGTAVLGLTMECCRCHDHKYDPITTRDYYSLSAFFNSIDENGLYDRTEKVPSPSMLLPTEEQASKLEQAKTNLANAKLALTDAELAAEKRWQETRAESNEKKGVQSEAASEDTHLPDLVFSYGFDKPWEASMAKKYVAATNDKSKVDPLPTILVSDSNLPRFESEVEERRAIELNGEIGMAIMDIEPIDRWTPFTFVMNFRETKRKAMPCVLAQHSRGTDAGYNGWDLMLENGFVETRLYRVWPGNAIGVRTVEPIPTHEWHQVSVSYDGSSKASGLRLFLNGKPLAVMVLRDKMLKSANVNVDHGGRFVLGQRFRSRGFDGGQIDDVQLYRRALSQIEIEHLSTGLALQPNLEYFQSAIDADCRDKRQAYHKAMHEFVQAEESMNEIPIMEELSEPLPAYVLARGEYDAPKDDSNRVTRSVPAALNLPFPQAQPLNRMGLAEWVLAPNHPLTARVMVNRIWANFFGAGLVRTPENFGLTGELPTHPELLDWLARDFIQGGWNIKTLCKSIVLSSTYRQDSNITPEVLAKDPENRWYARGPSHRLAAEQIRDLALVASGLWDDTRGGPPVSPYQAGGDLWRENNVMSPPYVQSVGKSLYRRSVYSVWKRTAPLPNMMAFDTNSREVCTVKRQRTNTPLQALVLMNDIQFIESARCLAERLLLADAPDNIRSQEEADVTEGKTVRPTSFHSHDQRHLVNGFLAFTGRRPKAAEVNSLLDLLREEREYYRTAIKEAEQLIEIGEAPTKLQDVADKRQLSKEEASVELASLTNVLQVIFNLDATVWSR